MIKNNKLDRVGLIKVTFETYETKGFSRVAIR